MSRGSLKKGDSAPTTTVLDWDGQPVELESLWQAQPLLLVFLRHFG